MRMAKPILRSSLNKLLCEEGLDLVFHRRERRRAIITNNHRRSIPRIVPRESKQYWDLAKILRHREESCKANNLALKHLHHREFGQIEWNELRRTDLLAICTLAGAWRGGGETVSCPSCGRSLHTVDILTNSCGDLEDLRIKNKEIRLDNLGVAFESLESIASSGRHTHKVISRLTDHVNEPFLTCANNSSASKSLSESQCPSSSIHIQSFGAADSVTILSTEPNIDSWILENNNSERLLESNSGSNNPSNTSN